MLALTGCTGKIGGAVFDALLTNQLIPPSQLVVCTSSSTEDARWDAFKSQGGIVRHSNYDDPESMVKAFSGCTKLFLVSTPRVSMDFFDAPPGQGRERHHTDAIRAAQKAGVKHIYYTSLAFGPESVAGVMRAHLRTEAFLKDLKDIKFTVIREGLYNESWPLYFGYYDLKKDDRDEVVTAGDGPISWTSIADLGLASALVVVDPSEKYVGKTFYLSNSRTKTLKDIAAIVSKVKGREIRLKTVSLEEHCEYYITKMGRDKGAVEWWCTSYAALERNECWIKDSPFNELLSSRGRQPKPVEETIEEMLKG
ncbi:hypothetical protein M430DRAFT_36772 [Amorphotheca resinae ATCC 22711]|jgi:uncharacterized protein YbjT (DUF2867 family)|uniref:NmrA-like domain-containing protein n=1 Tax=Amorphotheca resinae ATCC 22711 TaxID=857342 RepID=A0A2T3AVN3_AMORE|nr:hypothetical protein M430DRAFT_36772 [Amorphotheca resinae ATCC 22711]PSS12721.1 hypothetical protein M430DRAFT_36772 [Amorphotheca resinae ATCC 22711]